MEMNKKELEKLVREAKLGNEDAKENIITTFEGYIYTVASSYYIKGYDMDDLLQLGRISVYKAIKLYDLNKSSNGFMYYTINAVKNNFLYEFRKCKKYNYESSLNAKSEDSALEYIDYIEDSANTEEDYEKKIIKEELTKAIKSLPQPEQDIIIWEYYLNKNLKEYANLKNLKYSYIIYHKKKALKLIAMTGTMTGMMTGMEF